MKHYEKDSDRVNNEDGDNGFKNEFNSCSSGNCYTSSNEVKILLNACDRKKKATIIPTTSRAEVAMSTVSSHRPPSTPIYDGYATIRSRGLYRSRSIRASAEFDQEVDDAVSFRCAERKRTVSLISNFSQGSNGSNNAVLPNITSQHSSPQHSRCSANSNDVDEIYVNSVVAKTVKTPIIGDLEPLYASANSSAISSGFRPLSDASSSSEGVSNSGCRDCVIGSTYSGTITADYLNQKKNSRFSLDSLQSSVTPKTPDYLTAEEENFFLYTAPESPKHRLDSGVGNSYEESEYVYSSGMRSSFEMQDNNRRTSYDNVNRITPKSRRPPLRSASNASTQYQRTHSLSENIRPLKLEFNAINYQRSSESKSPTYMTRNPISPTAPPPTPIRRESLYAKPKIYDSLTNRSHSGIEESKINISPLLSPTESTNSKIAKRKNFQLQVPEGILQRSSSAEILEKSFISQSLATIDQDEILVVPNAMPEFPNPIDRRYHTLGHMRVQSVGAGLYHAHDSSPIGSMLNMSLDNNVETYGWQHTHLHPSYKSTGNIYGTYGWHHMLLQPSYKSTGNIYGTADRNKTKNNGLVSEYFDPLDYKIGCQTTLRSKPLIPWYELATRDFKRKSCPPVSGNGLTLATETMSTSQYGKNQAHVVAAFEQSLANMTSRLQQLTATAERKDGELTDMRQTIELLRKQSIQAGLTTAHMQSMGVQTLNQNDLLGKSSQLSAINSQKQQSGTHNQNNTNSNSSPNGNMQRHLSSDSMCSLNSISSGCSAQDKKQKKKGWLRSSFTKAFSRNAKISKTSRHAGHHHQQQSQHHGHIHAHGHKDSSNGSIPKSNGHGYHTESVVGLAVLPGQPAAQLQNANIVVVNNSPSPAKSVTLIENAKPIDAIDHDEHQVVEDLKKQLREKDLVLTDIRLEALSSASQLESLKETVNKMRAEMMTLKQNNERLQKLVTSRSLAGSEASLGNAISPSGSIGESRRYSLADGVNRPPMELPKRLEEEVEEENIPPAPAPDPPPLSPTTHIDLTPPPPALESIPSPAHIATAAEELPDMTDGKKISIACYLGQPESFTKYYEEMLKADDFYVNGAVANGGALPLDESDHPNTFSAPSPNEFIIAYTYISGKTTWQNLDYIVRKTFKDYLSSIDPGTNLGLNTDSITSYHLGEAKRGPEMGFPELLPCGYIIGNVRTLYICLQGVGSLAFDSLIPRSIVHRYISLMTEHRRLILCGPSGTGKSYLARRLAEFLVARSGRGNPSEAIATFNVDHKSSKELRQYLSHIAEQASIANGASELPSVIILDNLHHASALGDVFSCLLSAGPAAKLPCIIGTMSQATCNTTNLQLHHNFRWVLTANHMEPVKGFLGRFLRRRLFQLELQTQHSQTELGAVLAWLPTVWQHINRFLETHSSSDVTIGPRLFLSCPLDLKDSQVWFTDIWNYHLSPYLVEAVREGVQLYGRRGGAWNDPSVFIRNSYPWPYGPDSVPPLRQINAEDVGLEGVAASSSENQDPLLNMLIRLQEAANYSENQDQESDCASLDSNITPDSSAGAE